MNLGSLNYIGVTTLPPSLVAPAQAGAHYVSPLILTGEIGTSLRWRDGFWGFKG